jgi:proteasome accessory factor C
MLALVPWLVAHPGVTVAETAQHFGVNEQQLEKDLYLLICSGLPGHMPDQLVDIQFWDEGGHIEVIDPQVLTRPLRLTADEAMCLLVGLRALLQIPGDHDRSAVVSAASKLEQVAGGAAEAADRVTITIDAAQDAAARIADALARGRALHVTYAGASRDEITERTVDPLQVLVIEGRAYLAAWCRMAEAVRTFRLDRILDCAVLEEPAIPRQQRPETVGGPRGFQMTGTDVLLELGADARWVAEVHPVEVLDERPDGSLSVRMVVGDERWLVRLALSLGGRGHVTAPEHLVTAVQAAAAQALR